MTTVIAARTNITMAVAYHEEFASPLAIHHILY